MNESEMAMPANALLVFGTPGAAGASSALPTCAADIPPLELPRCWIGHMPDGSHRIVEMGANNAFIVTTRTLIEYQRREGVTHLVTYALSQVTPVPDGSHVWMTEVSVELHERVL